MDHPENRRPGTAGHHPRTAPSQHPPAATAMPTQTHGQRSTKTKNRPLVPKPNRNLAPMGQNPPWGARCPGRVAPGEGFALPQTTTHQGPTGPWTAGWKARPRVCSIKLLNYNGFQRPFGLWWEGSGEGKALPGGRLTPPRPAVPSRHVSRHAQVFHGPCRSSPVGHGRRRRIRPGVVG